jgi:2-oxo-4-hydroxy-4-carboxy-5-ureidoimidazoline decarboxylase
VSAALNIEALNGLDLAAFTQALGALYEHSPWVAARAWEARPFADRDALHAAMIAALEAASPEARLELIRAHPELAGKAALAGDLTAASRDEQASAGLGALSAEEFARFHALNDAYRKRFGFPFIICVRLTDKAGILAAMQARLAHSMEAEVAEAVRQIGLIGRLRLEAAVAA